MAERILHELVCWLMKNSIARSQVGYNKKPIFELRCNIGMYLGEPAEK